MQRLYPLCLGLLFICFLGNSVSSYAQVSCGGADGFSVGGGLIQELAGDICANSAVAPARMRIEANNVDDEGDPSHVGFQIDWNDGSMQVVTYTGGQVIYDPAHPHEYKAVVTHLFPPAGANVRCEYFPTVRLMIDGTPCPSTLGIPPRFVRWNTENQNSGVLRLTETATSVNEFLVCKGAEATITFSDRSTLNCVPPNLVAPNDNDRRRWRRYRYGTTNTITSATGVEVGGAVQTYPYIGPVVASLSSANVGGPRTPVITDVIKIPADTQVGQVFEITMDYWNVCNPFTAPGTSPPPISITARVRIVDQPVAPTVVNNIVCFNTSPLPAFTTTITTNPPVIRWYRDNAGVPGTAITNPAGVNSKTLAVSAYPGGISNAVAGVYRVWVSYSAVNNPDGKTCESQRIPITLTIAEDLTTPAAITGPVEICDGNLAIFTLPASGAATVGGATQYEWQVTGGSGMNPNGTTATSATYNVNVGGNFTSVSRTVQARRVYSSAIGGTGCPSAYRQLPVTIYGPSLGGTVAGGGTICQGSDPGDLTLSGHRGAIQRWEMSSNGGGNYSNTGLPANATVNPGTALPPGNYLYRAVVANGTCAEANSNAVPIVVSPNTSPASTGADQALCTTSTFVSNPLGGSDPAPGTGLWTVVTKPASSNVTFNSGTAARNTTVTVDKEGIYRLRWTVTSGICTSSDDIVIDFGKTPAVPTVGTDQTVCGPSYNLNASVPTIGTGVWSVTVQPAGGTASFSDVNSPTATVTLTPGGTEKYGTYRFRWTVTSGTCPSSAASVAITFNRAATATVPANFTTCVASPGLAAFAVTGTVAGPSASQPGRWEIVSGTGTFTSNNGNPGQTKTVATITDNYKPSAGDYTTGSVQLRLVALDPDAAGPCTNTNSTTLTITFDKLPGSIGAGAAQPLVCNTSTALAAAAPTEAGIGTWTDLNSAGVSFSNANDRTATVSNLPVGPTTLRWTVRSALNVCAPQTADVVITRNALPTVNNLTPEVCETTPGTGNATNVVLTNNNNAVTGSVANTTVEWFTEPVPGGPVSPAGTPQSLSTAFPNTLTFFTRVTNSVTTCQNTGTVTYAVTPIPTASTFTKAFCEDMPVGSNRVNGIDLTAAEFLNGVTAGESNRSITWYLDAAATAQPIGTPTSFNINGSQVVYARVRNTVTLCENVAAVNLNIKPRPLDQPIQGKEAVCVNPPPDGLTLELYKVSAVTNATYQWTIPANFDTFLGGSNTDILTLLSFPSVGQGDIKVRISVDGCEGNELTKHVEVSPTPQIFTINGPATVCEDAIGVAFHVDPDNGLGGSNYNWEISPLGGAVVVTGQTKGVVQINFLKDPVTIKVTESNSSNCAGPPQQMVVAVNPRPSMTDGAVAICSEDETGITLTAASNTNVPAAQFNVISAAVDPGLFVMSGPTIGIVGADGILHDKFENPTGGSLRVRYTVEPVSADGCPGPSKVITVTVKPEPRLDVSLITPVCSSAPLGRVLQVVIGSVAADLFIIDDVTPDSQLTPVSGDPLATGTFDKNVLSDDVWRNQTGGVLQVTYSIRPYNSGSQCAGTPAVPLVFNIYPEPVVDAGTKIICSGDAVNLTLTSSNLPGGSFAWGAPLLSTDVSGGVAGIGSAITDILTNTGSGSGTAVYAVKGTGPAGMQSCEGAARNITITVNPAPAVHNIPKTLCSDLAGGNTVEKDLATLESDISSASGVTITWYSDANLNTQITPPAMNAYPILHNTPIFAKVDNGTCFNVATVTYTINPLPQLLTTRSLYSGGFNVSCAGSSDGEIVATANSGTVPYLFRLNSGSYFPTGSFNALAPSIGNFVTVKDDKGCEVKSPLIDIVAPPALTITGTPANAKCKGSNDGSIQIVAGGGVTGTYTYSLNGGTYQVSPNFAGVSAGTHTITVKDANSCTKSNTVVVGEPALLTGGITAQTNVSCNGLSTGSVTVAGNGGTAPYQYALDSNPFQVSGVYNLLPAGSYTITVKDVNDCTATVPVVITEPAVLTLNLSVKTDVNCNGNSTGALTVAGSGGTPPYQYSKDSAPFQNSGVYPALAAGTYNMEVRDAKGCTAPLAVVINQPPPLTGSVTAQTNVLCFGTNTASVTVNGVGGSGIYQFKLDAGTFGNSGTFASLSAGSYTVTVRDQGGCTFPVPVVITQPVVLGGLVSHQSEVSCFGGSDGTVDIAGSGGVTPYQYELDASGVFQSPAFFNGLAAGSHTVVVRDANLCTFPINFTITEPTQLTAGITAQHNVDCKGNATGDVTVEGAGGTAPYEYAIDGLAPILTGFFDQLPVGGHTVRVRDAKGCQAFVQVTIIEPNFLTVAVQSKTNVDCHGKNTGSVTLIGQGGTAPYEYADVSAVYDITRTFVSLQAGTYDFTVRDGHNCITPISVVITEPDVLTLANQSQTDVLCHGQNSGSVTVQAAGGAGSYEYSKNDLNYSPLNVFGGLTAGQRTITVRDFNGCKTQLSVTIIEPDALAVTSALETKKVSCYLGSDGELTVTATGGNTSLPYTYLLLQDPSNTSGQTTGLFTALRASNNYTVRITDVNNCSLVTSLIAVTQPDQLKVTGAITSDFHGYPISCENATDGVIKATSTGGTGPGYTYAIAPDPNNVVSNTDGIFTNLGADLYTITVTDANNCSSISLPVVINPPFPMTAGFIGFDYAICANDAPRQINSIVLPFGGTQDYHYQWKISSDNTLFTDIPGTDAVNYLPPPNSLPQPLPGQSPLSYYFKRVVTLNSGGCGELESNVVIVKVNPLPTVVITSDPVEVCEGELVTINLAFTGQSPYRFDYTKTDVNGTVNVNNGIGGDVTPIPVFNYSETATFTVTRVKDFNGCQITPNVALTVDVKKINSTFSVVGPASQCGGRSFSFQWTVDPNVEYTWEWADGGAPQVIPANSLPMGLNTISHIFTALPPTSSSTNVPVTLSAESVGVLPHCGPKRFTKTIELFPSVYVDVPTPASPICSGTLINFQNLSQGATIHSWVYHTKSPLGVLGPDVSMGANKLANQTFVNNPGDPNPITYEVVYTGNNTRGCSGTKAMEIVVYKNVIAQIKHTPVPPTLDAGVSVVTFENISSVIDGANFIYAWDFGTDATPAVEPDNADILIPVTYSQAGAKRVTLTVTNRQNAACSTTDADLFTIIVPPLATDFRVKPLYACSPATLEVENLSRGADTFLWTLMSETGSMSTSNLNNPVFVVNEPGLYSLTLETKYSVSGQTGPTRMVENITIYARPQAIFTARPKTFFVPDVPVSLANDSQGANAYEWNFGDGATSIDVEPDHQYELEGTYVITLRALNDHGSKDIDGDGTPDGNIVCSDTVTQVVTGREGGATKIPNAFTPNPSGPTGGVDNGAGMNDVFLPITSGVQEFLMQVFDRWGNLVFESKDKNIGWDGYDKDGRLMPAGVYVYKMTLRLADDQRETRIGDITLIR